MCRFKSVLCCYRRWVLLPGASQSISWCARVCSRANDCLPLCACLFACCSSSTIGNRLEVSVCDLLAAVRHSLDLLPLRRWMRGRLWLCLLWLCWRRRWLYYWWWSHYGLGSAAIAPIVMQQELTPCERVRCQRRGLNGRKVSLVFVAPILEPNLNLCLAQVQRTSQLRPLTAG